MPGVIIVLGVVVSVLALDLRQPAVALAVLVAGLAAVVIGIDALLFP